jgi:hypothetical protein
MEGELKIYVASSWRNQYQPAAVIALRKLGHSVYDFRGTGTGWGEELNCPDCQAAKRHAYSDATTPGFFFTECSKHRGPGGFAWSEVDPAWQGWPNNISAYLEGLKHPRAVEGFNRDMDALKACDVCILVNPCGQSAHLELGWAAGAGKRTAAWCPAIREPDLMLSVADHIAESWDAIEAWLDSSLVTA